MWILIKLLYYPAVPGFFKSWLIWVNTGGRLEISWWLMQSPCTLCLCSDACLACWLWENAIWWLPDKEATQCTENTEFLYCPANTYQTITYHAWYSWQAKTPLQSPQVSLLVWVFSLLVEGFVANPWHLGLATKNLWEMVPICAAFAASNWSWQLWFMRMNHVAAEMPVRLRVFWTISRMLKFMLLIS